MSGYSDVRVADLTISEYRGRAVLLNGTEARFTGTHRGTAHTGGPYIVVHGIDSAGRNHQQAFTPLDTVLIAKKGAE
ncbi:hypothetical protein [Rhodococcus sp. 1168]|uniref:hypothetical protein n=1 Tax=Rhodococcus sp. 1168 TaxID=2018041 RepID=UPI000A0E1141|nr:hypothetical protein [Rhodococcus sp. 1168]ORI13460.1 hypothetical protein BJI47_22720 [Rhodococcus sp. 1168]